MVVAEKLVTALQRGRANTRWRDFADLFMLVPGDLVESEIIEALRAVAKYRSVPLQPLGKVLDGMPKEAQARWTTWRQRPGAPEHIPEDFAKVLDALDERTKPWFMRTTEVEMRRMGCGAVPTTSLAHHRSLRSCLMASLEGSPV